MEGTILPENFIDFSINFDPNITQTQILTLKPTSILTLTQILILTLEKAKEKCTDEFSTFLFYSLQPKFEMK